MSKKKKKKDIKDNTLPLEEKLHKPLLKYIPFFFLCFFSLVIIIVRLHTYNEPLERDLTEYAVFAHEMLHGRELYSDLWDQKPPAIFITYAIGEIIAGYGHRAVFLINVSATILTLAGVYLAGSVKGRSAGIWAAALWTVISGDMMLQANQPNSEVFLNTCLVFVFAFFARADGRGLTPGRIIILGLFTSLASLYKQVVMADFFLFACVYVIFPPAKTTGRKKALLQILIISCVIVLCWALVLFCLSIRGSLNDFYRISVVFNKYYSGNTLGNIFIGLSPEKFFPPFFKFTIPAFLFIVPLLVYALLKYRDYTWFLMLAYIAGTHISVCLPGKFHPHYYQLWLPVIPIAFTWCASVVRDIRKSPFFLHVFCGFIFLFFLLRTIPLYGLPAEEWTRLKLPVGDTFVQSYDLARELDALLEEDETFYVWGGETGIYFISKRSPPAGLLFIYPMLDGPMAEELTEKVLSDLKREKPAALVINTRYATKEYSNHPVIQWFAENYRLFPDYDRGLFWLMVRNGSDLEKRLNK